MGNTILYVYPLKRKHHGINNSVHQTSNKRKLPTGHKGKKHSGCSYYHVAYTIYWDEIPDMILFDYDFNGVPKDICEKEMIWYNLLLQIIICVLLFVLKTLICRLKLVRNILYDSDNKPIPLVNKRFSLFTWELSMLFVTTEQGYVFDLVDIVESPMCDDIVTAIFLFWLMVLILEFRADIRKIRSERAESENGKDKE